MGKSMVVKDHVDGVVIGLVLALDGGVPKVVFPGNPVETAIPARSLAQLRPDDLGAEVALLFEDGDRMRPLIIGRIVDQVRPGTAAQVVRDGERITINASQRLELRVGKSVIILEADGHITIRGTHLVSHASGSNRIRGGSVNLN
jgi:hypothetical protein